MRRLRRARARRGRTDPSLHDGVAGLLADLHEARGGRDAGEPLGGPDRGCVCGDPPGRARSPVDTVLWIHLVTLCFVLKRGWPVDQAIRLRRVGADAFAGWPWLEPPGSMGDVTVVDVAAATPTDMAAELVRRWVNGAWAAWIDHHPAVIARADELTTQCP